MIRAFSMLFLPLSCAIAVQEQEDMLRFTNGDQLRGTFTGLQQGPVVTWSHDDLTAPAEFKTERIRQIVLNGGRPQHPLDTLAHAALVNNDLLPGRITALDADTLTLETTYAGKLLIPRTHLSRLAPNPMGGRLYYHGPFAEDEWRMTHPAGRPDAPQETDGDSSEAPGKWTFNGAAWYWQHKRAGTALIRESAMPECAVLRFDIAWKNRLSLTVAFHADFSSPKVDDEAQKRRVGHPMEINSLPRLFGNSHVLQLYSNYLSLVRTSVDESGKTSIQNDTRNNFNMRIGDSGRATVEIRSHRRSGDIMLFINEEFVAQWNGPASDATPDKLEGRSGIGFLVQADDCPVRISDIIVCEWNGMPDSARSLQTNDHDVVLMTNGTDRYAGRVATMDEQGKIIFEGRHGQFRLPLDEIAEIRFARNRLSPVGEAPEGNLLVRLSPIGALSGLPVGGDHQHLEVQNPLLGKVSLSLAAATLIDLNPSHIIIDDWDHDF